MKYLSLLSLCLFLLASCAPFASSPTSPSPTSLVVGPLPLAPECSSATSLPDTGQIAFISDREKAGHYEIYIMKSDGSSQTKLTDSPISASNPLWSPDGKKIYYLSDVSSANLRNRDIFVMNADGSEKRLLVKKVWRNPVISPDGSRILFARLENEQAESSAGSSEIYSMNIDGSNLTRLTNNNVANYIANWSPDGKQIVFVDNGGIYVINADGNGKQEVTGGHYPTWSPDGSRIAFNITRLSGLFDPADTPTYRHLFTIQPDGTDLIDLYDNHWEDSPQWSPNSIQIAFFSVIAVGSSYALNVINSDGSGGVQLMQTYSAPTLVWSPNGEWIAMSAYPVFGRQNADIVVVNSKCSGDWNLTNGQGDNSQPAWSPK